MSRRLIVELAAALKDAGPSCECCITPHGAWCDSCTAVADALVKLNPAFDKARFLRDCGVRT